MAQVDRGFLEKDEEDIQTPNISSAMAARRTAEIVVIGETPYAEGLGDRADLGLSPDDVVTIIRVRNAGVPLVVILISGRPMMVSPWIDYRLL